MANSTSEVSKRAGIREGRSGNGGGGGREPAKHLPVLAQWLRERKRERGGMWWKGVAISSLEHTFQAVMWIIDTRLLCDEVASLHQ